MTPTTTAPASRARRQPSSSLAGRLFVLVLLLGGHAAAATAAFSPIVRSAGGRQLAPRRRAAHLRRPSELPRRDDDDPPPPRLLQPPPTTTTALRSMEEGAARRAAAAAVPTTPNSANGGVPAFLYALNSSTKWLVTIAHTLAVWTRPHQYTGPYIVVGSILAVYLTDVLKKLINQGRPNGAPFADPGMPSSHALVSFFAAVAWSSVLDTSAVNLGILGDGRTVLLVGAAALIAALRVICGYHSVAQIVVGAGVGSILGRGWALLGEALHTGGGLGVVSDPRLILGLAWGSYLGGSAFFIRKNMRHWVGRDAHH